MFLVTIQFTQNIQINFVAFYKSVKFFIFGLSLLYKLAIIYAMVKSKRGKLCPKIEGLNLLLCTI